MRRADAIAPDALHIPGRCLTEADAAMTLGVTPRTMQRWRLTGDGPRFVRLGLRRIGYRAADLDAWTEARAFTSRADEANRTAT